MGWVIGKWIDEESGGIEVFQSRKKAKSTGSAMAAAK
jgi:hypothetical protein